MSAFKYIMLFAILFIGVMAFFSSNDIIQQTQPAANSSFLANQSSQNDEMIDLSGAMLPGLLILAGVWVLYKIFGNVGG